MIPPRSSRRSFVLGALLTTLLIAAAMLLGGWLGAKFALPLDPKVMKGLFGAFLVLLGAYLLFDAYRI